MRHDLKIHPVHYQRVRAGTKTFEIRKNDRSYQKYDEVTLREWCPIVENFTDEPTLNFTIGDVYRINHETVVFSLIEIDE